MNVVTCRTTGPSYSFPVFDKTSSAQFKSVSMRSGNPIFTPTSSLRRFPKVAFETVPINVRLIDDGYLSFIQGRSSSTSFFHASLLQAIAGVMSLAVCSQVVSQVPQH